jgi:hypothetical protein
MYYEVLELACLMMGEDYDTIVNEGKEGRIENMLFDKYGIDIDQFELLIKDLIKFTPTWKSLLTESIYQGFVVPEGNKGLMRAIIKQEVK